MSEKADLFVAVPSIDGRLHFPTLWGLMDLHELIGSFLMATCVGDSCLPIARARILAMFMASDKSRLLMLDSDIGFKAPDVQRMMKSSKRVVAGVAPQKTYPDPRPACIWLHDPCWPQDVDGNWRKARGVGGAFVMVHREALEVMGRNYEDLKFDSIEANVPYELNWCYALFNPMIVDGLYLPEDYSFCRRWLDVGGDIWVDTTIGLTHSGNHEFRLGEGRTMEDLRPIEVGMGLN